MNLAAAALACGAEFRFRSTVTAVEKADGRVTSVRLSDGTRIPCAVVVNAAGPWSGAVNQLAGVGSDFTVGVRPMRQEVAHVPVPEGYGGPVVADMDLGAYFRGVVGVYDVADDWTPISERAETSSRTRRSWGS